MCDRIISPLKSALTRYCNEGNDILSASDMHRALEARKVKGTTAAVCEIDSNQGLQDSAPITTFLTSQKASSYPVPMELAKAN